ncbi:MAG: hypothetical protein L3J24_10625 [Xanthomonadales bacterium]|nr:hypothetical protein [Xanthomonadales bacterium]
MSTNKSLNSSKWLDFPYDAYSYAADELENNWDRLHLGDCEPWPENPELQQAWRHYHQGEFAKAYTLANKIGLQAHVVANKACGMYANHLEEDDQKREAMYNDIVGRAEAAAENNPEDVNAWYFQGFALGRLSQLISIMEALKKGYGGKIKTALENTLELEAAHAEAHIALGLYHAEVIDKIGKFIGSMTYGASEGTSLEHFQQALALTPDSPVAHMEYGNGLYLLYGDKRIDDVSQAYVAASECEPFEAMEILDRQQALAELE